MTKETFDKFVKASKGCPVIAFGDNAILFNINHEQHYIVQDDTCVMIIHSNTAATNCVGPQEAPFEVQICEYDQIQYIRILPDRETLMEVISKFNSAVDTGADPKPTVESIKKDIASSRMWHNSSPRGVDRSHRIGSFGGFTPEVVMGKQADPDMQEYIKAYNDQHKQ